jgi:hypothetical protein
MVNELQSPLEVLKKEFAVGQARLQDVQFQEGKLRETFLRISGAIQVLEELLAECQPTQETTKPPETFTTSVIHQ